MTLTEFLEARIAEDEAGAADKHDRYDCNLHMLETYGDCSCDTPARVLAECVAKRRIVERYSWADAHPCATEEHEVHHCGDDAGGHNAAIDAWDMLRTLASVYANHPDYQPKWA